MASIHKDRRFPKGPYYCYYSLTDGRQAVRSTGKKDRREARVVCDAIQQAEYELGEGDLTKDRLQEIFNETLKRLGQSPVERLSVKDWLGNGSVPKPAWLPTAGLVTNKLPESS